MLVSDGAVISLGVVLHVALLRVAAVELGGRVESPVNTINTVGLLVVPELGTDEVDVMGVFLE